MYTAAAILGALLFVASLVIEGRGRAGVGATPPSNEAVINTLRLGGVVVATIGVAGALILNAASF
jgi:hypothetical protein